MLVCAGIHSKSYLRIGDRDCKQAREAGGSDQGSEVRTLHLPCRDKLHFKFLRRAKIIEIHSANSITYRQPASETVKRHIKLLHDYNDIRDVGQGLVGMIADNRGVRIGELYEEFGVGLKD